MDPRSFFRRLNPNASGVLVAVLLLAMWMAFFTSTLMVIGSLSPPVRQGAAEQLWT